MSRRQHPCAFSRWVTPTSVLLAASSILSLGLFILPAPRRLSSIISVVLLSPNPDGPSSASVSSNHHLSQRTIQRLRRSLFAWQTATPYTDPNNICSAGATGYRASKDCTGYMFCNNGYLMGGGEDGESVGSVTPCGPGTLFDNDLGACSSSMTRCPGSSSSSSSSSVSNPEKPPSTSPSRAEPAPSSSESSSTSSISNSAGGYAGGRPSASQIVSSSSVEQKQQVVAPNPKPTNRPSPQPTKQPIPKPSPLPTKPSASSIINSYLDNNNQQKGASSMMREEPVASPSASFVWIPGPPTTVNIVNIPPPSPTPEPTIASKPPMTLPTPVPTPPTPFPTALPKFEGDAAKRYCGYGWTDVIQNCLTAIPCPQGFSMGVCPNGMKCIADTPCSDNIWLDYLRNGQGDNTGTTVGSNIREGDVNLPSEIIMNSYPANEDVVTTNSDPIILSPSTTFTTSNNNNDNGKSILSFSCHSDRDCPYGQFCTDPGQDGYCVDCLPNGKGCSTDQICVTSSDGLSACEYKTFQAPTVQLGGDQQLLASQPEDSGNKEEVDTTPWGAKAEAMYQNPQGNGYFCGHSFAIIKSKCLQSKPCPSGVASRHCSTNEGCFFHPTCQTEYESAGYQVPTLSNNQATNPSPTASMSFAAFDVTKSNESLSQMAQAVPAERSSTPEVNEEYNYWNSDGVGTVGLLSPAATTTFSNGPVCLFVVVGCLVIFEVF